MSCSQASLAVFAKCPIAGQSKTRLSNLLGYDGAALLAQAMLSDILTIISKDERFRTFDKFLVYAPGTDVGEQMMTSIVKDVGLNPLTSKERSLVGKDASDDASWTLLPMATSADFRSDHVTESNEEGNPILLDLRSSSLGSKLAHALKQIQTLQPDWPVVFLGMDSPELPMDEIYNAVRVVSWKLQKAYMNPAQDGGYGMLCLPVDTPLTIFQGVRWSSSLTAVSQVKALSDNGIDTILGSLMNDIDEPDDVIHLAKRLIISNSEQRNLPALEKNNEAASDEMATSKDRLLYCSEILGGPRINDEVIAREQYSHQNFCCIHTFQELLMLGIINQTVTERGEIVYTLSKTNK